jgi:UDP-glucose 4-epimerase
VPHPVLVTGAGGFIGRPFVAALLEAGHPVLAVVRDPRRWLPHRRLTTVSWDLLQAELPAPRPRIDVAVHLAAKIPGLAGPSGEEFAGNVTMTGNLVNALTDVRHLIFASTIDVYGRPHSRPIREDHPTEPDTSYGVSKLQSEARLRESSQGRGFTLTVLRLSQVYGPGDRSVKIIPRTIDALLSGRPPVLYGDGSDLREYAYVDDVVRALCSAVARRPGGTFNLSGGAPVPVAKVVEILMRIAGTDLRPVHANRQGERVDLVFDIARAREALNFVPRTTLEEGLRRQYEWARGTRS